LAGIVSLADAEVDPSMVRIRSLVVNNVELAHHVDAPFIRNTYAPPPLPHTNLLQYLVYDDLA